MRHEQQVGLQNGLSSSALGRCRCREFLISFCWLLIWLVDSERAPGFAVRSCTESESKMSLHILVTDPLLRSYRLTGRPCFDAVSRLCAWKPTVLRLRGAAAEKSESNEAVQELDARMRPMYDAIEEACDCGDLDCPHRPESEEDIRRRAQQQALRDHVRRLEQGEPVGGERGRREGGVGRETARETDSARS
jgi:hypothetical protein